MGIIRVLPESIANKIAAGEVIERPASIVKELIENAVDANATSIEIEIKHGGKSLIRVSDNGCGMSRDDAKLAFARHATSKIRDIDDLNRIASFGFRGEALPSIAAVSRINLITGQTMDSVGTELRMEGGKKTAIQESSPHAGTTLEVRDLFFNTPARRKFLRSDPTEMGHVLEVVSHLALAHPNVRFLFLSSGRTVLDLITDQELLERARAVLGEELAIHLLPIDGSSDGVQLSGLIGKPVIARSTRAGQSFFVNRRWVRAVSLSYALQDGFSGLIGHGQFPTAILFLKIDPERVDVNVHPTKREVRLSHEIAIKELIAYRVSERLRQEVDLAPRMRSHAIIGRTSTRPFSLLERAQQTHIIPATQTTLAFHETILPNVPEDSPSPQIQTAAVTLPSETSVREPIVLRDRFQVTRILGQVHLTFIVAETVEGLILVDQHAAHERVMFEELLNNFKTQPERQVLLLQQPLELPPRQADILKQSLTFLERIGFDLESFGPSTIRICSYPAILGDFDPAQCLKAFFDEKEAGLGRTALHTTAQDIAALIACKKASVKASDILAPEAMTRLLARLSQCDHPYHCPHGRPALIRYPLTELERQFKRT